MIGLMDLLIGNHKIPLEDIISQRHLCILGISDNDTYASILENKFDYVNTFMHKEPKLDVCNEETFTGHTGKYDAIICSDVIEHTSLPPRTVLQNMKRLLRTGGGIILSAPTSHFSDHVEWYPSHRSLAIIKQGDEYVVEWQNLKGCKYVDRAPIFHGGPGNTLEMRQISHVRLLEDAMAVGLAARTIEFAMESGYVWPLRQMGPFGARGNYRVIRLDMTL